jgi:hypothetical protein
MRIIKPVPIEWDNGYRVFPGGKERPGRDADPSFFSSAVGHERVELYLYSPYGPYGLYRASVSVQGCTLPFTIECEPVCAPEHTWKFCPDISVNIYYYDAFFWISYFFSCGAATQRGSWPSHSWDFLDHTQRCTTDCRTPLDERSARRRGIP